MVDRPEFLVAVNKPYELFLDLEGKQLLMYLNTDFFKGKYSTSYANILLLKSIIRHLMSYLITSPLPGDRL